MSAPKPSAANKFLRDLVKKFPDAPALTLAKTAYKQHPEMWSTLETCRTMVRGILGTHGKQNRKSRDASQYREPRKAGWVAEIPSALADEPLWGPVEYPGPHRALILSDIHIPFHDAKALEVAIDYGVKRSASFVLVVKVPGISTVNSFHELTNPTITHLF